MKRPEAPREAEGLLANYPWPGNVREVKLAIQRASHLRPDGVITAMGLSQAIDLGAPALWRRAEGSVPAAASGSNGHGRTELLALCAAHEWRAQRVAEALGIGRSTLYRWLRVHGIDLRALRSSHLSQRIPGTTEKTGEVTTEIRG